MKVMRGSGLWIRVEVTDINMLRWHTEEGIEVRRIESLNCGMVVLRQNGVNHIYITG